MEVELLAPAGDMQSFKAAIFNGADAVYLGLKDFNARAKAENFTTDNIAEVVQMAHLFNCKVFVTVNTLVKNCEIEQFLNMVKSAVLAKVDAFLVQDFGVAKILKSCFPNICLHSSTQMGIHNLQGAKMAEKLGFSRVVLSRETKLEDIIDIKKNTNLEIEYFVQGALCVAFSGNCYFSALCSGESGNRGRCKQYCRMVYNSQFKNEILKQGYLLSPADLCLIKNLKLLIDAGVKSFKIEGRLRRTGYVAQAVKSYRKAIDYIYKNKELDFENEIYKLKKVFNRGNFNFESYLKNGVPNNIIYTSVQNHLGIPIGTVEDVKPFKNLYKVIIKTTHQINNGDGLKFFENNLEQLSIGVGNVDKIKNDLYCVYTKHQIKPGWVVNLILDFKTEENLINIKKEIGCNVKVYAKQNNALKVVIQSANVTIEKQSEFICQKAKNCVTSQDEIITQFRKTGDTYFNIETCIVDTDGVFIPKSVLNELRRNALELLKQNIIKNNTSSIATCNDLMIDTITKKQPQKMKNKYKNVYIFDNFEIFNKNITVQNSDLFVFAPSEFNNDLALKIKSFHNKNLKINLGILLPIIANHKDILIIEKIINSNKHLVLVANNIYGLYYLEKGFDVFVGTGLNMFNNFSESFFAELGCCGGVVSVEQSVNDFNVNENTVYSFGDFVLMTFCHCPFKTVYNNTCSNCSYKENLTYVDKNAKYKIRRYKISQCYFELLNSNTINNLGKHNYNKYLDLRNFDNEQFNIIECSKINKEFKLNNSVLGCIFNSVK